MYFLYDRNLTNHRIICLSSGKEILCKAISYCHHFLFSTVYGKFEEFGCDLPKNQQAIALPSILPNDNYQQICISSGLFHAIGILATLLRLLITTEIFPVKCEIVLFHLIH